MVIHIDGEHRRSGARPLGERGHGAGDAEAIGQRAMRGKAELCRHQTPYG